MSPKLKLVHAYYLVTATGRGVYWVDWDRGWRLLCNSTCTVGPHIGHA